ncbi:hypothetical protein [Oceaniglobus trochenteri]|uniref:hypothetical protein n=1 Tax=Oceaniglobus trochenteri TaxID=2763260 RepID=UPI001CFFF632|nr:hypothetical protein [Oceaniglobus trochenteri]
MFRIGCWPGIPTTARPTRICEVIEIGEGFVVVRMPFGQPAPGQAAPAKPAAEKPAPAQAAAADPASEFGLRKDPPVERKPSRAAQIAAQAAAMQKAAR